MAPNPEDFLKAVKDALHEKLFRSSVPIVIDDQQTAGVEATGVLFRAAERHFLLSASHVLQQIPKNAARLGVALADDLFMPLAAGRATWASDDDRYDVGAVLLTEPAVAAFKASGFRFLDVTDVHGVDPQEPPDGGYVVFGYPTSATTSTSDGAILPVPHYLSSIVYRGDTSALSSTYDPEVHVLLHFDRSSVRNTEDTGELATAPDPHGVSGGSVWWAYAPSDVGGWRPEFAKLVGLQSSYFRSSGLLKFTPWQFIEWLLAREYPDIAPALRLRGAGRSAVLLPDRERAGETRP